METLPPRKINKYVSLMLGDIWSININKSEIEFTKKKHLIATMGKKTYPK